MFSLRAFLLCTAAALFSGACVADPTPDQAAKKMAAVHQHDEPVPAAAAAGPPVEGVLTQTIVYGHDGDRSFEGFIAWPDAAEKAPPALILIHEWWGLNDNIREMARKFAAEGYIALAVELYDKQTAETSEQAEALMTKALGNDAAIDSNLRQAYEFLKTSAQAPRVGSVGWCFGGGISLRAALLLPGKLDATVMYYGFLVQDKDRLAKLDTPILGLFGEADTSIPPADVEQFAKTLKSLDKSIDYHIYPGANHAFANPSGTRYHPEAAADAWKRTLAFLHEHLQEGQKGQS
jgi:carboxymethylenebutenolidase